MNAREAILARVRGALSDISGDVPGTDAAAGVPTGLPAGDTAEPPAPGATPAHLELFAERVADYQAVVVRCTAEELGDELVKAFAGAERILVPADLPTELRAPLPAASIVVDEELPVTELDRVDGVLTTAAAGIAETGTIVLDHGPGQGRRAATLVPDLHVCVVYAEQIVPGVPEAVARLDPRRPLTWISGPSATSDIELSRVEGVHGPRRLRVLLLG